MTIQSLGTFFGTICIDELVSASTIGKPFLLIDTATEARIQLIQFIIDVKSSMGELRDSNN